MNVLKEALVVGIISAIVGLIISTALMYTDKNFKLSKYHFWPQVAFAYFITGVILHLGFEAFGANKWYCKHGTACSKN